MNNISRILKKKNISIYKLNDAMGLSYSTTHRIVNQGDLDNISLGTVRRIAKYLEVDILDLFSE